MGYSEMRLYLTERFNNENNFTTALQNRSFNIHKFEISNDYNLNLVCNFPGYKSRINRGIISYDYRIDYKGIAISHVNIVVDIYNKVQQHPAVGTLLFELLCNIAIKGNEYERELFVGIDMYSFNAPSTDLIQKVKYIHRRLGKQYQDVGNLWNYSLDEIAHMVMWIVIQEDINYPMPRYLGRRMSFFRYLEAIYAAEHQNYTLDEVIEGALSHRSIRDRWIEVNYEPIKNLSE